MREKWTETVNSFCHWYSAMLDAKICPWIKLETSLFRPRLHKTKRLRIHDESITLFTRYTRSDETEIISVFSRTNENFESGKKVAGNFVPGNINEFKEISRLNALLLYSSFLRIGIGDK